MHITIYTFKKCRIVAAQTYRFFEAEVCAHECEGHRDAKPQGQDGHQGAEGDGSRGPLHPQDEVHQEEISKHNAEEIKTSFTTEPQDSAELNKNNVREHTQDTKVPSGGRWFSISHHQTL